MFVYTAAQVDQNVYVVVFLEQDKIGLNDDPDRRDGYLFLFYHFRPEEKKCAPDPPPNKIRIGKRWTNYYTMDIICMHSLLGFFLFCRRQRQLFGRTTKSR